MSAHPIMAQAVAPFAPSGDTYAAWLRKVLRERDSEWQSLLRLPFGVEVETRPAGRNGPAEYAEVYADEADVVEAVDALIDRHIDELEADVKRRMLLRRDAEMEP